MTDTHGRSASLDMLVPAFEPPADLVRRHHAKFDCGTGPAFEDLDLYITVVTPADPVRGPLQNHIANLFERLDGVCQGVRAERWTKTLVDALMPIDCRDHRVVKRLAGVEFDPPLIGQCGIDRQSPRRAFEREAIKPFRGDEVEQCRRRDEISRSIKCKFKIAGKINRARRDCYLRRTCKSRSMRKQGEIIVDKTPALLRREMWRYRTQGRTRAATKVDNRNGKLFAKAPSHCLEDRNIACPAVVGLPERQPACRKPTHRLFSRTCSKTSEKSVAGSRQVGNDCAAARAPAANFSRSLAFSITCRNAFARACTSSGATRIPAPGDTVSGMAPAVV